jgi:hypothetical protein
MLLTIEPLMIQIFNHFSQMELHLPAMTPCFYL